MTISNAGEDEEQSELPHIAGGNVKWCSLSGSQFGCFWETNLPGDPAISLLGIYSREIKTHIYTKAHMWMFRVLSLWQPETGNGPDVLQQVNGYTSCSASTQQNTAHQYNGMSVRCPWRWGWTSQSPRSVKERRKGYVPCDPLTGRSAGAEL